MKIKFLITALALAFVAMLPATGMAASACTATVNADGSTTYNCPQGVTPSPETAPAPATKRVVSVPASFASHLTRFGYFQSAHSNEKGITWSALRFRSGIDTNVYVVTGSDSTIQHNHRLNTQRHYEFAIGPAIRIGNTNMSFGPRWLFKAGSFHGKPGLGFTVGI